MAKRHRRQAPGHLGKRGTLAAGSERNASLFQTKSQSWREVGLARQLSAEAIKRARIETFLLFPLIIAILLLFHYRQKVFGVDTPVRIATVVMLLALGWAFARGFGRALQPVLFRRLDPSTAGTLGFLVRLVAMVAMCVVALRIAGIRPETLTLGGAFTAVVVGLAAQQTLGNLFAGTVLLSARPFRVGDRVKLKGGGLGGEIEGVVSALGLLYTTLQAGEDSILVPNSMVLNAAITPLCEPASVDLRATFASGTTPADVQQLLEQHLSVALLAPPEILLEEISGEAVIMRIVAKPQSSEDGAQLASEVAAAIARPFG